MLCSLKISCIKYDTSGAIELSGFLKLLDIFGHFIHVDFSSLNNYILWTLTFFFFFFDVFVHQPFENIPTHKTGILDAK